MTELEMQVDKEIGNDVEYSRMLLLKYVNYGKRIAEAELADKGLYTIDQVKLMEAQARAATASEVLMEVDVIMRASKQAQDEIEAVYEDKAFADLMADESGKVLKSECAAIIDTVDSKHSVVIHERDEKFKLLNEKYLSV